MDEADRPEWARILDIPLGILYALATILIALEAFLLLSLAWIDNEPPWAIAAIGVLAVIPLVTFIFDLRRRAPRAALAIAGLASLALLYMALGPTRPVYLPPLTTPLFLLGHAGMSFAFAIYPRLHRTSTTSPS